MYKDTLFIQSEDAPTDDTPLFPEFKFGFEIDFQPVPTDKELDANLHTPDAIEMLHHQWRPPDVAMLKLFHRITPRMTQTLARLFLSFLLLILNIFNLILNILGK